MLRNSIFFKNGVAAGKPALNDSDRGDAFLKLKTKLGIDSKS